MTFAKAPGRESRARRLSSSTECISREEQCRIRQSRTQSSASSIAAVKRTDRLTPLFVHGIATTLLRRNFDTGGVSRQVVVENSKEKERRPSRRRFLFKLSECRFFLLRLKDHFCYGARSAVDSSTSQIIGK